MELVRPASGLRKWSLRALLGALAVFGALIFGLICALSPYVAAGIWGGLVLAWLAARRLPWVALSLFLIVPLGRLTWLSATGALDVTKILIALLGIAWGIRCLARRDGTLLSVWTESPVCKIIVLFFLANLLSLLSAYDLIRSVFSLLRLTALFVMLALIVAMVRSKRDVKVVLALLLFSGLVICILGVWESRTHQYLWMRLHQSRDVGPTAMLTAQESLGGSTAVSEAAAGMPAPRTMTVFNDYNFMGGYMAILLGVAAGCFLADRRWYLRLGLGLMVPLIAYNLVQTGSRGGLAGCAVTALVLLLLSRIRIRWFILLSLVVAAILFFPVVNHFAPQFRGGISLRDLEQDQRYGYWQMALHMVRDHPIIGVGTDNFVAMYPFYRVSPALMRNYYCHNIYLQMWAEAGIFGLATILALVGSVMLAYRRALRSAQDEGWRCLVLGLFAAFVGYAVFSATCNTLHDQPLWLLISLSVITLRATLAERAPASSDLTSRPAEPAA